MFEKFKIDVNLIFNYNKNITEVSQSKQGLGGDNDLLPKSRADSTKEKIRPKLNVKRLINLILE